MGETPTRLQSKFLDRLYPGPTGWVLHESSARRFLHRDLCEMTLVELRRERGWLVVRLRLEPCPDPWLRQRLTAIDAAIRKVLRG